MTVLQPYMPEEEGKSGVNHLASKFQLFGATDRRKKRAQRHNDLLAKAGQLLSLLARLAGCLRSCRDLHFQNPAGLGGFGAALEDAKGNM